MHCSDQETTALRKINELTPAESKAAFHRCCGSEKWADAMAAARPFVSADQMYDTAEKIWWSLDERDWKEAFTHHPKIGDVENLRKRFATTATWSEGEQSGMNAAGEAVIQALAVGNSDYETKFGYIFIVCATGKTAEQMLQLLQSRLPNEAGDEIRIAAGEQAKITKIRLEKLCQEVQSQPTS